MRNSKLFVCVVVLAFLCVGCDRNRGTPGASPSSSAYSKPPSVSSAKALSSLPAPGMIRFTPADSSFFVHDDLKRVLTHLDLTTGCVKIEYSGPNKWLSYGYEIWEDGVVTKPFTHCDQGIPASFTDTFLITISTRDCCSAEKHEYKIVQSIQGATGTVIIPALQTDTGTTKALERQIEAPDDKETAVWSYIRGKGTGEIRGEESIEDMAKRCQWAIVFKVTTSK